MKASEFVSLLFEVEEVTHIAHLQSKSYSVHMALNEIYTGIVDLRDTYVESYSGKYGIITSYISTQTKEGIEPIKYLQGVAVQTEEYRLSLNDGYLQQICDDILTLIYQTLYKLINLK